MNLGLDLSSSTAKIIRALEHVDTLEAELRAWLKVTPTYGLRFDITAETGWCSVMLTPQKGVVEPRFGVLLGDVVHNLRSALDYVVASLVEASNSTLVARHKFPIYADKTRYLKEVGTPAAPRSTGPLGGVRFGGELIESVQPYKRQPEPRVVQLWAVHRLSNADKHRQLTTSVTIPMPSGPIEFDHNGRVLGIVEYEEISDWSPHEDHEIARLKFDRPLPTYIRPKGTISMGVLFTTGPFGDDPDPLAIQVHTLRETCDYVRTIVNLFKTI